MTPEDPSETDAAKKPFEIDAVMGAVRAAVRPYPPAALFQLSEEGYATLFAVLIGCIISIRTRDEETLAITRRFLTAYPTPEKIATLTSAQIADGIEPSQFAGAKGGQIQAIARVAVERGGELPCDYESLLLLPGVGPKCANLALGIACGADAAPHVGVDVHVDRVTNRWGLVAERNPEATMRALDARLPAKYRLEINRLLVPFGKHVCTAFVPAAPPAPFFPCAARSASPSIGSIVLDVHCHVRFCISSQDFGALRSF